MRMLSLRICLPLHKGGKKPNLYTALSFPLCWCRNSGDPSVGLTATSVSLRLGHGAALTCPRHVIHYRAAASLPKRDAKGAVQLLRQCETFAAKRCPF